MTGCRWWTGARGDGYGQVNLGGRYTTAHRAAFEIATGINPDEHRDGRRSKPVCHTCDNGRLGCVEPSHLYLGTASQNAKDRWARQRWTGTNAIDITGRRFGFLTVIGLGSVKTYPRAGQHHRWIVRCDCGRTFEALSHRLRGGQTARCLSCHKAWTAHAQRHEASLRLSNGMTIAEVAAQSGVSVNTVYRRWLRGWPVNLLGAPLYSTYGAGGKRDLPERRRLVYPNHGRNAA